MSRTRSDTWWPETGARISGARWWFHVACTDLLTLLDCHGRRGMAAFEDMAVLPFFSGVLVSRRLEALLVARCRRPRLVLCPPAA